MLLNKVLQRQFSRIPYRSFFGTEFLKDNHNTHFKLFRSVSFTNSNTAYGVEINSSKDDIKKAFRKLAKEFHPDHNPEAADKFTLILKAYDILGNEEKRKEYNEKINAQTVGQTHGEFFNTSKKSRTTDDYTFSFFFNKKVREEFAEEIYCDFQDYFGGADQAMKSENILMDVSVDVSEVAHGATFKLVYSKNSI